jgi:hypothetical protein
MNQRQDLASAVMERDRSRSRIRLVTVTVGAASLATAGSSPTTCRARRPARR